LSTTSTGASYYVLNTAANGLPDANLRVLVLQVTTTGAISGTLNYQVFPLGVGADQVQISMDFDGAGTFGGLVPVGDCDCDGNVLDECGVCGGTGIPDEACDCDGNVLDTLGVCGGLCMADLNNNGVCDNEEIFGCLDTYACNYNPVSLQNDDSCDYTCCPGPGCCDEGLDWDWEQNICIDSNPTDINLDGCTDLNDLMDFLSAYGTCETP
jgi:hypothetical protein